MNIRKLICALLAMLLLALPVLAEEEDDFGFDFSDDGYTGEWLELTDLGIELCLPDGWDLLEAGEDVDFAAKASDGSAALSILKVADDVTDLVKWAEEHVESYELDDEGFFDTLYTEDDAGVTVYRLYDGKLLAFDFTRQSAEKLPLTFALQIVESANESWPEEGEFLEEDASDENPFAEG